MKSLSLLMLNSRPLTNRRGKQGFPDSGMNPESTSRTIHKAKSKDIQSTITKAFANPESKDFMSLIADLMESYGVMNLSKETGIDRVTLWRFMRGDRLPRLDTFQKILATLGIKVQFSFEDRMQNFLEYTYWRKQWEEENRSSNGSHKANGTRTRKPQEEERVAS